MKHWNGRMNAIDKTTTNPSASVDFDRFRLRNFIDSLAQQGELDIRPDNIDLADIAEILEGNPKAVWFKSVGPEKQELVGNVIGSRARLAHAFGVEPDQLLNEIQRRLRNRPEMIDVGR